MVEDIGGAPADLDDEEPPDHLGCEKHELRLPPNRVALMLSRAAERTGKNRPGRPRDAHKDMWTVADIFSDVLDSIQLPFPTQSGRDDGGIGVGNADALDHQAAVAECMRAQQNPEVVAAKSSDIGDSALPSAHLTEEAALLPQSTIPNASGQGPLTLARALARAATLNADQMGAVALVANAMQTAWEEQGRLERMQHTGRLSRMLLLGGGGCGKTRIINLVLTALSTEYYGPRGVVEAAPSNKACGMQDRNQCHGCPVPQLRRESKSGTRLPLGTGRSAHHR